MRLALLDRDGTINVKAPEGDYVRRAADLVLLEGAAEAVARLNAAGIAVAVVTNQRGVSRGLMTLDDVSDIHDQLLCELALRGATIDRFYVCPHASGTCTCRKPAPGMVTQALADFGVVPEAAWLAGDAVTDVGAGVAAGVRSAFIGALPGPAGADLVAPTLAAVVDAWASAGELAGEDALGAPHD